jgi:hypothetical protein
MQLQILFKKYYCLHGKNELIKRIEKFIRILSHE